MLINRVQVPPHSDAATRIARDVLEERSDLSLRMELDPEDAATRSESSWRGLAAEVLEITATRAFKYGISRLLPAFADGFVERGALAHGETRIEGVVVSTRRDIGRTLSFIPKGYVFQGTFMPRILPRCGNLYIDPALTLADPEFQFGDIEFEPQLFFDEPGLWSTARKILRLVGKGDDNRLYAETLTAALAIELVRFRGRGGLKPGTARGGLAEWQRRAVVEFINDNLERNISLTELASLARLSPTHFCKAFTRSMSMPPHQYQLRQRVERAKLLLADTERSITEVALATGYTASSNFATAFRKVTGVTPRAFQRSLV